MFSSRRPPTSGTRSVHAPHTHTHTRSSIPSRPRTRTERNTGGWGKARRGALALAAGSFLSLQPAAPAAGALVGATVVQLNAGAARRRGAKRRGGRRTVAHRSAGAPAPSASPQPSGARPAPVAGADQGRPATRQRGLDRRAPALCSLICFSFFSFFLCWIDPASIAGGRARQLSSFCCSFGRRRRRRTGEFAEESGGGASRRRRPAALAAHQPPPRRPWTASPTAAAIAGRDGALASRLSPRCFPARSPRTRSPPPPSLADSSTLQAPAAAAATAAAPRCRRCCWRRWAAARA